MIPPTADFRERILVRDALAAWRERLLARHALDADEHYEAIMRHAHAAWDRDCPASVEAVYREHSALAPRSAWSSPTLRVIAVRCERCGAQKPIDGTCVSCVRVRA